MKGLEPKESQKESKMQDRVVGHIRPFTERMSVFFKLSLESL